MAVDSDYKKILKIITIVLRSIGIRFTGKPSKDWKELFNNTYISYTICLILAFNAILFTCHLPKFIRERDFDKIFFLWPCICFISLALHKTLSITMNTDKIELMLTSLEKYRGENRQGEEKAEYDKLERKECKFLKFVVLTTLFVNSMLINFSLLPVINMIRGYIATGELVAMHTYPISYPLLDTHSLVHWPIVYLHQISNVFLSVTAMMGPDCLLYTLCNSVYIQFQALGYLAERIVVTKPGAKPGSPHGVDNEVTERNIALVIRRHQELLEFVEDIDAIYSKSNLFNVIASSIQVCVNGFNILVFGDAKVLSFLNGLCTVLWQITMFCYYADLIMRSNADLMDAMFRSDWYLANMKVKKMVLTLIIRSQKPCRLTAYKFIDVDLLALRKVLSTSWSYFALVNTMYSDPTQ